MARYMISTVVEKQESLALSPPAPDAIYIGGVDGLRIRFEDPDDARRFAILLTTLAENMENGTRPKGAVT